MKRRKTVERLAAKSKRTLPDMRVRHHFADYIWEPLEQWKAWVDDGERDAAAGVWKAFHHVAMDYIMDTATTRNPEQQKFDLLMWRSYIDNWLKIRKLKTATGRRLKASMERRSRKVFRSIEKNRRLFKRFPDISHAQADRIIKSFGKSRKG